MDAALQRLHRKGQLGDPTPAVDLFRWKPALEADEQLKTLLIKVVKLATLVKCYREGVTTRDYKLQAVACDGYGLGTMIYQADKQLHKDGMKYCENIYDLAGRMPAESLQLDCAGAVYCEQPHARVEIGEIKQSGNTQLWREAYFQLVRALKLVYLAQRLCPADTPGSVVESDTVSLVGCVLVPSESAAEEQVQDSISVYVDENREWLRANLPKSVNITLKPYTF